MSNSEIIEVLEDLIDWHGRRGGNGDRLLDKEDQYAEIKRAMELLEWYKRKIN